MNIALIGAGIVGVTTAYELAADGHQVTVFERHGAVAEETSFANAGIVAPGYVTPWAAPGMPGKVLGNLLSQHAAVRLGPRLGGAELGWIWKWLRACRTERYLSNRSHLQQLAFYSRERLQLLRESLELEYDRSQGYMVLLRSDKDRQMVQAGLQVLKDAGVRFRDIGAEEARKHEPALNPDTDFVGAIHLPDDEVGNCRQFALLLRNEAQRLGVRFEFNTTVTHLHPAPRVGVQLGGEGSPRPFDAVVVCAGLASAALLRPLGLKVPLVAVHGYSVSAAVREPLNAPRSAVMDERYKVAISRLGQRVRVAGSAELGRSLADKRQAPLRTLYKVLQDWFPGAARMAAGVQEWKGARPMLPDGPPLLGASGVPGIWLNLGHGSSGWALSCGSARALADNLAGRPPQIELDGFSIQRYR
ncbi:MAG: D-amino acid dehydrogenase [Curvibacter sp.]|nr:D-amino acid dehydrogenase [Curvibacter sp.]